MSILVGISFLAFIIKNNQLSKPLRILLVVLYVVKVKESDFHSVVGVITVDVTPASRRRKAVFYCSNAIVLCNFRRNCNVRIVSEANSHAIAFTSASSGRVFPPYRIQTKLGRKKLRQQGNRQENLGACSMRGAPRPRLFVCLYVASPFDTLRTEKTADFGVESHDPTANLCPSSKIPDFLRLGGGGSRKGDFRDFWGGCFVGRLQPT